MKKRIHSQLSQTQFSAIIPHFANDILNVVLNSPEYQN